MRTDSSLFRRLGWSLSVLAIAFFVMDASMKLLALPVVLQANSAMGFEGVGMARTLGALLLGCTVLYVIPSTAVLGAVLLTGYLGGTVAAHLRVGDPFFTHVMSGVYGAILAWGGLYLRDARLRALVPLRLAKDADDDHR
jgi:hypothetical protein